MIQETEMMQRPARMVGLHNSAQFMNRARRQVMEQDVPAETENFYKRLGEVCQ